MAQRNTITKEGLIQFIEKNFDELQCGGCADYYSTDYGMNVEDVYACEMAIYKLLANKGHPKEDAPGLGIREADPARMGGSPGDREAGKDRPGQSGPHDGGKVVFYLPIFFCFFYKKLLTMTTKSSNIILQRNVVKEVRK